MIIPIMKEYILFYIRLLIKISNNTGSSKKQQKKNRISSFNKIHKFLTFFCLIQKIVKNAKKNILKNGVAKIIKQIKKYLNF